MSMIQINDLTFAYEGNYDDIFTHVTIHLDTDWKLGFIGRNGRGKTTLLRLLMGELPYQGKILASVRFDYFPFAVPDEEQTPLELAQELCPCPLWQFERELNLLGLADGIGYQPFNTLSHGERTKVLLATLFLRENNFLLIDEPTNHLDAEGRRLVSQYLSRKKGYILVSHDRAFLDGCIDHVLSVNKASIDVQQGNFSSWQQNRDYKEAHELAENDRLQRDIAHLNAAKRRTADWSDKVESTKIGTHVFDRGAVGHKAAKMMARSKAIQKRQTRAIEEKSALLHDVESADALSISPLLHHANILVEGQNLSVCYGRRSVFDGLDIQLRQGERLALTGGNGSGKSTLLRIIAGDGVNYTGQLRLASGLIISYVPQDSQGLQGDLRSYARDCGIDESRFKTILRKLDFPRVQFEKDMADYSAGQKKKVLLARSLCQQAHLYIWDEPLNYVDIISRMQIEELLRQQGPSMLLVEHDAAFIQGVSTRQIHLG